MDCTNAKTFCISQPGIGNVKWFIAKIINPKIKPNKALIFESDISYTNGSQKENPKILLTKPNCNPNNLMGKDIKIT
ncbi:MAG: hypothetical protein IPH74_15725 [Bacteroidetes bacterium]|nr:hypothetical protein [Bacteroidota bacterium]